MQTIVDTHTRVYVIVAVRVYREGIVSALSQQNGIVVVGAADGASLAYDRLLGIAEPDVVLLGPLNAEPLEDIGMVRTVLPGARIVMVAVPDSEPYVLTCARCGVAGLVTVEASLQDLVAVIRGAQRDGLICSPRTAMLLGHGANGLTLRSSEVEPRLTARERQIAELVSIGLTNKEIASRLHIELSTVKNHVHNVLAKLEVTRRFDVLARIRQIRAFESAQVRLEAGRRTAM